MSKETPESEYPTDTGNPEADGIIGRLASSDPDFDDCVDAVALIRRLVAENKGPGEFATWKDAAVAERVRRVATDRTTPPTDAYPPLPRHDYCLNSRPVMEGYTAAQMREYAQAALAAKDAEIAALKAERDALRKAVDRLDYEPLFYFAKENNVSYNALCTAVRAAIAKEKAK